MIKPNAKVPELALPLVGGGEFRLSRREPKTFTLVVFYRGLHCPVCRTYLRDLDEKLEAFSKAGVEAVAVSCDTKERAEQAKAEWQINRLPIAYGLSIDNARRWGSSFPRQYETANRVNSRSRGSFLSGPTATSTPRRYRPCLSRGRRSPTFLEQSSS